MAVAVITNAHHARRLASLITVLVVAPGVTGAAEAQTSGLARPWRLVLGLQERYETNPPSSGSDEASPFVTDLNATLSRAFPGRRRSLGISASGGVTLRGASQERARFNWGVRAAGKISPSRKADLDLSVRSAEGYYRDAAPTEGEVPPYTRTRIDGATASFRYRVGPALEARLEALGNRYRFPDGDFESGSSVLARGALSRALGGDASAGVTAEWELTRRSGQEFGIVRGQASGQWRVGQVLLLADGGVSAYRSREPVGSTSITPTGAVAASVERGRHTFSAQAGRQVGQLYGFGAVGVSRTFSLGYSYSVSRRLRFAANGRARQFLSGSYSGSTPPDTQQVSAVLSYQVTRTLDARLAYSFWRQPGGEPGERHTLAVRLSRAFSWR